MSVLNLRINKAYDTEKFWLARKFFLDPGAIKSSDHGLRTGAKDDYYFDLDYILNDPYKCELIANIYTDLINDFKKNNQIDLLGFIEKASGGTVGALRLSAVLSIKTFVPNIVIRMGKAISFEQVKVPYAEHGIDGIIAGLRSSRVLIVTDHCTSGDEVFDAASIIAKNNGQVKGVVAYTVKSEKIAIDKFKNAGIQLNYAYGLPEWKNLPNNYNEIDKIAINY